mmetsp:Transcript_87963/g.175955  ORF Transcript_87963/g.175955 Transcript_87963/m.175955 type:complete len:104 (+) Transcript_87963:37-348(+)
MSLFARSFVPMAARTQAPRMAMQRAAPVRQMSALKTAYAGFMDTNMKYITFIVGGCVAIEFVYGGAANMIWDRNNAGKLTHHVDWTEWAEEDEEDEDGDEEDE